ncbi:MAG: hypothetical protein ACRDQX_12125, partial [Pseudonocardiaceae bacterium]
VQTADSYSDEDDDTAEEDISTLPPLCDEATFAGLVAMMVANEAPRLFALVEEFGERVNGEIAAWGMAFDDHVEIVSVDDGSSINLSSLERAAHIFSHHPTITARVVWVNPDAATPP